MTTLQDMQLCKGKDLQKCPLCGMEHPKFVDGLVASDCGKYLVKQKDKGYSFCNCRNIFFTDWSNIEQEEYGEGYTERYNNDSVKELFEAIASKYFPKLKEYNPNISTFLEIGCINGYMLREAFYQGWTPEGLDINPYSKSKQFKIITGNLEDDETLGRLGTYDVIWASHIFEHFKDPLKVAQDLQGKLTEDGLLFVAMPDPWFINWNQVHSWAHWIVKEHHIMWDMDSFIDAMEELGYECLECSRHVGVEFFHTSGDFHLIFKKGDK